MEADLKKTLQTELLAKQKNMALEERVSVLEGYLREYENRNRSEAQNAQEQLINTNKQIEFDRLHATATEEALRAEIDRLKTENLQLGVYF